MTKKKGNKYDLEFKKMIVQRYVDGVSVEELCKDFQLIDKTVYSWIKNFSTEPTRGNASKENVELSNYDINKLKKEINNLKQENEVLKKCITIFSKK